MIQSHDIEKLNNIKLLIRLQEDFNPFMLEESLVNWYFDKMRKEVSLAWKKGGDEFVKLQLSDFRVTAMLKTSQTAEHLFRAHCYQLATDKIHDELMSK